MNITIGWWRMHNKVYNVMTNQVLKQGDNFYYHSEPASGKYYDSEWGERQGYLSPHDKTRTAEKRNLDWSKYSLLISPTSVLEHQSLVQFDFPLMILDVCAGHGGGSMAMIDMGAGMCIMCDGSGVVLNGTLKCIKENTGYEKYREKIIAVQADVENIRNVFRPQSFDLVFQSFALMHMRNPMKTVQDLASLVKPGGTLCFNFFKPGCTPQVTRDLRNYFLKKPRLYVRSFFMAIGGVDPQEQICTLEELLNDTKKLPQFDETIVFLKKLCDAHGTDSLQARMSYEDCNTPYLHNIDPNALGTFIIEELGLSIVEHQEYTDNLSFTLRIPDDGVKMSSHIPDPSAYSPEDISLGDSWIGKASERP
jgi:ubiquinone/menaquinone biosynthesis C-methylase UbiE